LLNKLKQEKCHISSRVKDLTKIAEKCLRKIPEYSQPAKPVEQKETV
jgi:ppGpp synthetase/RelA/SpoT-type nucleotidyltranferase